MAVLALEALAQCGAADFDMLLMFCVNQPCDLQPIFGGLLEKKVLME